MRITESQLRKIVRQEIKTSLSESSQRTFRGRRLTDDEIVLHSDDGDEIITLDRANDLAAWAMPKLSKALRNLKSSKYGIIEWNKILKALFSQYTLEELKRAEVDVKKGNMGAEEFFDDVVKRAKI